MWLTHVGDLGHVPHSLTVIILASPGLGAAGTFGAGNAARGGESLSVGSRFLASWHLVLL